ncbi:hypothetical protein D5S17_06320 [Pseudonocardiaceae bacterium YIM PH 21723]|nr:hypothetical protein D5S17_06320 [Pseudonocardiaceae bacterium YIM PH 21723]
MIWVAWRKQRTQLLTLCAFAIFGAAMITWMRAGMLHELHELADRGCPVEGRTPPGCIRDVEDFVEWSQAKMGLGQTLVIAVPALFGMFIGAPLFARDLEQGTFILMITQSVSRARWLAISFLVALGPTLAVTLVLQALVGWWVDAAGDWGPHGRGALDPVNFAGSGLAPASYTLFAVTAGLFAGCLIRRTTVGMLATLGGFVALRVVLAGMRTGRPADAATVHLIEGAIFLGLTVPLFLGTVLVMRRQS